MSRPKHKPRDYPFNVICEAMKQRLAEGFEVYQKFTCAGCGQRLTMPENGVCYETGTCDKCSTVTNIRLQGCNYMLVSTFGSGAPTIEEMVKEAEGNGNDHRKH